MKGALAQPRGTSGPDLTALATAAQDGDDRALDALFGALAPSMHGVIRTVVGRGPDTEDLLHDALIELLRALSSFRHEAGIRHYACRIALFVALRHRRRGAMGSDRIRQLRDSALPLGGANTQAVPPDGLGAARKRAWLELLDALPEEQAQSLALRVVLGCSLGEVAKETGVPLNTVRSRIRLAKEAIRRRVAEDPTLAELFHEEST
ncbi:MAG: RNA polymerase sigma factor [Sandaracinaceae bacterium]